MAAIVPAKVNADTLLVKFDRLSDILSVDALAIEEPGMRSDSLTASRRNKFRVDPPDMSANENDDFVLDAESNTSEKIDNNYHLCWMGNHGTIPLA